MPGQRDDVALRLGRAAGECASAGVDDEAAAAGRACAPPSGRAHALQPGAGPLRDFENRHRKSAHLEGLPRLVGILAHGSPPQMSRCSAHPWIRAICAAIHPAIGGSTIPRASGSRPQPSTGPQSAGSPAPAIDKENEGARLLRLIEPRRAVATVDKDEAAPPTIARFEIASRDRAELLRFGDFGGNDRELVILNRLEALRIAVRRAFLLPHAAPSPEACAAASLAASCASLIQRPTVRRPTPKRLPTPFVGTSASRSGRGG